MSKNNITLAFWNGVVWTWCIAKFDGSKTHFLKSIVILRLLPFFGHIQITVSLTDDTHTTYPWQMIPTKHILDSRVIPTSFYHSQNHVVFISCFSRMVFISHQQILFCGFTGWFISFYHRILWAHATNPMIQSTRFG